jgi:hypothetical protein
MLRTTSARLLCGLQLESGRSASGRAGYTCSRFAGIIGDNNKHVCTRRFKKDIINVSLSTSTSSAYVNKFRK